MKFDDFWEIEGKNLALIYTDSACAVFKRHMELAYIAGKLSAIDEIMRVRALLNDTESNKVAH